MPFFSFPFLKLVSFTLSCIKSVQNKIVQTVQRITSGSESSRPAVPSTGQEKVQRPEGLGSGLNGSKSNNEEPVPRTTVATMQAYRPYAMDPIEEVDDEGSSIMGPESTISSLVTSTTQPNSYLSSSIGSSLSCAPPSPTLTRSSSLSSGSSFLSTRSSFLGLSGSGTSEKFSNFIWDFSGRRRFQEASALHSILNPHVITAEQRPMSLPTPPATPIYSGANNFPVGDEDDVMSTITVSGSSSETRELVDQFAFIAAAAEEKKKKRVKVIGKDQSGITIQGTYWNQEDTWKEAERENMTAVCLEQWSREGTDKQPENGVTFRIAMNNGVPLDVLEWLKGVTTVMEGCARGLRGELESEDTLWSLVVEMNQRKIFDDIIKRFYQPLKKPEDIEPLSVHIITSRIVPILQQYAAVTGSKSLGQAVSVRDGANCLTRVHKLCERIVEQGHRGDIRLWKELLIQCYHLRRSRTFRAFLFSFQDGYELFRTIQKLGRYRIATQALIDAVRARPQQFLNVEVQAVQPPTYYDLNASIYPDADLRTYLRSILNTWRITTVSKENFEQIRGQFRERCADTPVVHAEMQLVKYYEENPKAQQPTLIGCGKKPCQLCVRFIHLHGKFSVEKTHARISHRWAVPNMRNISPESAEKIGEVLENMAQEMEDSLREIISLGPEKKPKFREVSSSTFASRQDVVPKNAGSRQIADIQHVASWDSGFVDSPSSSSSVNYGRKYSSTETPPPLHRLYHPPPPIPHSPPPLRRRRGILNSLNERFRSQEILNSQTVPSSPSSIAHSMSLLDAEPSSPSSATQTHSMHRASSPTLGWSSRFQRHSIDSPSILRTSLDVPPTPPPDEDNEEIVMPPPIKNMQVYHGSPLSSCVSISEDDPETAPEQQDPSPASSRVSLRTTYNHPIQSRPGSLFSDRRTSRSSQSQSEFESCNQSIGHSRTNSSSSSGVYTLPYQDTIERKQVDVEIVDTTLPPNLDTIKPSGRLPTPPQQYNSIEGEPSSSLDPDDEALISSKPRQTRVTPPKNIPHIIISSTYNNHQKQHNYQGYSSTSSSLLSSLSSSLSSSSTLRSPYPPSLSRRHNRPRLPPAISTPSPPLTPPSPNLNNNPRQANNRLSTASTASTSTATSYSSTSSYLSTTSHIEIPMDPVDYDSDSTTTTTTSTTTTSSTTTGSILSRLRNRHRHRHSRPGTADAAVDGCGGSNRKSITGVKSFLLRAVNKQQRHPAGGGESVSWISLDIGEDLLRGSDRFEVTAQLLPMEKHRVGETARRGNGLVLSHEFDRDEDLLVLDIDFGEAVLRLNIYW
ncbi:hypothetical protein BDZ91DRAFT_793153 [Kalaharituber pfeilii]|nr:hypothetical protein BDZ91DRAFT_793153 [Kalaharituber pfeilii]